MSTEPFKIVIGVTKDDIQQAMQDHNELIPSMEEIIANITDEDMQDLADKMRNDYIDQLYWDSLYVLFTETTLDQDMFEKGE